MGLDSAVALEKSSFIGAVWETYVLNQILCARAAAASAAKVFVWRDAQGTEVDFVLEHNGRLRLVEAKWNESIRDKKLTAHLLKVSALLGKRAANDHWVACRTAHAHKLPAEPGVKLVNGLRFDGWFSST